MNISSSFLDSLETALLDYIAVERTRLETERDFLLNVLEGRTDGVTIEDNTSDLVTTYLTGYLSEFIPIEEDE